MAITAEEIEREKKRLPRGWGRFGKSLDRLAEISTQDESLLSSCVGLNPEFEHRSVSLAGTLREMTESTNIVLGLTNRRLIVVATGLGGAPRKDYSIPLEGLEVASREKKTFELAWPDARVRIKGAAKQQTPEFLDALAAAAT